MKTWKHKDCQKYWWRFRAEERLIDYSTSEHTEFIWWCSVTLQEGDDRWMDVWGDFVYTQDDQIELQDVVTAFLAAMGSLAIEACLSAEEEDQ